MEIKVQPNIIVPDIPSVVNVGTDACLRDVLLIVTPQLVDPATGGFKDDPDIWGVRLNGIEIHSLKDGPNTKMHEGDTITLELLILAGG
ncbi:MAG: hypothetical protein A4E63_03390 [Syntrophorhabdus sp. PtaU1.Bin050]|nr:MAG: hypothetical protein A4E63_03390 [Syntrophorhabdus sp. PtaU1.Bin050]